MRYYILVALGLFGFVMFIALLNASAESIGDMMEKMDFNTVLFLLATAILGLLYIGYRCSKSNVIS